MSDTAPVRPGRRAAARLPGRDRRCAVRWRSRNRRGSPPPRRIRCSGSASSALVLLAGWFRLNFASVSATIGIDDTFLIATALLFGTGAGDVGDLRANALIFSMRRRQPARQGRFNGAASRSRCGSPAAPSSPWPACRLSRRPERPIAPLVLPLMAHGVVYFLVNSGLTAVAVGLDIAAIAADDLAAALPLALGRLFRRRVGGLLPDPADQQHSLMAASMVLPLLAVFHLTLRASFGRLDDARRHLSEVDRLYLSTVETLAMAIDAKDDVTHSHVRRVQAYAIGLAKALRVTDKLTLKAIEAAALLHDTGKLAVPERILNKPGKLTESEFERMKQHVDIGADILSLVEFPYPVVPIVRAHHESWDGSGYPRGLRGTEIPIGARILSVVDCFDALDLGPARIARG